MTDDELGEAFDRTMRAVNEGPVEVLLYLTPDRSWPQVDLGLPRHLGRPVVDTRPL